MIWFVPDFAKREYSKYFQESPNINPLKEGKYSQKLGKTKSNTPDPQNTKTNNKKQAQYCSPTLKHTTKSPQTRPNHCKLNNNTYTKKYQSNRKNNEKKTGKTREPSSPSRTTNDPTFKLYQQQQQHPIPARPAWPRILCPRSVTSDGNRYRRSPRQVEGWTDAGPGSVNRTRGEVRFISRVRLQNVTEHEPFSFISEPNQRTNSGGFSSEGLVRLVLGCVGAWRCGFCGFRSSFFS